MSGSLTARRYRLGTLAVRLAALPALGRAARAGRVAPIASPTFADPAFQAVWERYDRPVYYGTAARPAGAVPTLPCSVTGWRAARAGHPKRDRRLRPASDVRS